MAAFLIFFPTQLGTAQTPPTFLIYMMNLVVSENREFGGLAKLASRAERRAGSLYRLLEGSDGFYQTRCHDLPHRSRMNILFRIGKGEPDTELEHKFCADAAKEGLLQLFCHPLFPGCRVTLYNGIPDSAVEALEEFMGKFARENRS